MTASAVVVGAALGVALAALVLLARVLRGPTPFDRVLAAQALFALAALTLACLSVERRAPALLDAALAIVLMDAVLVVAAVKALRRNSFQPALAPIDDGAAS